MNKLYHNVPEKNTELKVPLGLKGEIILRIPHLLFRSIPLLILTLRVKFTEYLPSREREREREVERDTLRPGQGETRHVAGLQTAAWAQWVQTYVV